MSDFGAAPRMDWTLRGTSFEAASLRWGLPLLPHLYKEFARLDPLPALEISFDRLLAQKSGSVDRSWAKLMARKTEVCLFSRLSNIAGEVPPPDYLLAAARDCITEISPKWVAFAVGFNTHHGRSLQVPMSVPRTPEMVDFVARRVRQLRNSLGCEVALANVSSMFRYSYDTLSEARFWKNLAEECDVKIIFDIPAFFVSLSHQEPEFEEALAEFPVDRIVGLRVGALADSTVGAIDAECGSLSVTHWGLLEDVLRLLPTEEQKAIFLKWFEPLVGIDELVGEVMNGQSVLRRLGEL